MNQRRIVSLAEVFQVNMEGREHIVQIISNPVPWNNVFDSDTQPVAILAGQRPSEKREMDSHCLLLYNTCLSFPKSNSAPSYLFRADIGVAAKEEVVGLWQEQFGGSILTGAKNTIGAGNTQQLARLGQGFASWASLIWSNGERELIWDPPAGIFTESLLSYKSL